MRKMSKYILSICILLLAFTPMVASAATGDCLNVNPTTLNSGNLDDIKALAAKCDLNLDDIKSLKDCNLDFNGKNVDINDMIEKMKGQFGFDAKKPETPAKEESAKPAEPAQPVEPTQPEPTEPKEEVTTPSPSGSYEKQVVDLVNQERAKAGLSPLTENAALSNVAEVKAEDLRDNNYFSHTSPVYGSPFDMMKQFGIKYTTAGENIAKGQRSPEEVMNGWMNSEGHRANILNSSFTEIGVGYVTDSNGNTYWVQMFIRP